jgi:hypothetical protein
MIKIKIYELDKHRNETTFRPLLLQQHLFKEVGIEFVTDGPADFAFVGHASIVNKKISLNESTTQGVEFLNKVKEPYFIFDGQDAATLMGVYEVASRTNPIYILKPTLYKDRTDYLKKTVNGRIYWGEGNYSLPNLNVFDKVRLSHFNWLSTMSPIWYEYNPNKSYDISLLLGRRSADSIEHDLNQTPHYNSHRENLFSTVDTKYKSAYLDKGQRLSREDYLNTMYNCKIVLSPFGFGEVTPRDLEAAMFGCVLIKPDMSYLEMIPDIYVPNETYVACKHDFSDINEKIDYVLSDYSNLQKLYTENLRSRYIKESSSEKLVIYYYNLFKTLDRITTE